MDVKEYNFHFSFQNPFSFEVQELPAFTVPLLSFADVHPSLHLEYLYEGDLGVYFSDFPCREGDCLLIPPWIPHQAQKSSHGVRLGVVTILPEIIYPLLFERQTRFRQLLLLSEPGLLQLLRDPAAARIARICFTDLLRDREDRTRQLFDLMLFFAELTDISTRYELPEVPVEEYNMLLPALDWLRRQDSGSLPAEKAARLCGMNSSYFSRLFSKLFHETYRSFELRWRLNNAAQTLLLKKTEINAVAFQWDFCDASHFIRLFRRQFGCTPRNFVRQNQRLSEEAGAEPQSAECGGDGMKHDSPARVAGRNKTKGEKTHGSRFSRAFQQ